MTDVSSNDTQFKGPKGGYCIYLLKLMHPTKNKTYLGSTNNFKRRLRQHNGIITGGARYTNISSEGHKYKWKPIMIVKGEKMTRGMALQLEYRMKHITIGASNKILGKEKCTNTHPRVKKMIAVCNLAKWTKKCTVEAKDVPLRIKWFMKEFKPDDDEKYLPPYVTEIIIEK